MQTVFPLQQSYGRQASDVPVIDCFGDPYRAGCTRREPKEEPLACFS